MDLKAEPAAPKKEAKRVDPPSRPVHPEYVRGMIKKEDGWYYQRVHESDVAMKMRPWHLEVTDKVFPGFEVVMEKPMFRRADDTADETVARDMDTIWVRCRNEDRALLLAEDDAKSGIKSKQLRTTETEGGATTVTRELTFQD